MEEARLSREFRLAAACCIQPSQPAVERIRTLAAAPVDWSLFRDIVARQRIDGLANEALKRAEVRPPREIAAALAAAGTNIARTNLTFAAEAMRLHRLLAQAAIPHLFVKGATLGMLAHGSLALKHAWDIDLLVAREDVWKARDLLVGAGYRGVFPPEELGDEGLRAWLAVSKESTWTNNAGVFVELHHALMDNPELIGGVSVASPAQEVRISKGAHLPTLARDELFAYLCVHGASHAWSRLKWLADVAALLKDEEADELVRLHDRAVALGAGRCAGSALLLCKLLLGTRLPAALDARLRCDGATLWLVDTAVRLMNRGGGTRELDRVLFGTVPVHLSQFLLKPGLRFKLAELRLKLRRPEDHAALQLPRWLGFLYPLLLIPRWLVSRFTLAAH